MKLKSFGCSFIFGTELADDGRDLPVPTASNLTWPAHLAKHLNYDYECYARPGAGNLQISERVLSHLSSNDNSMYVIGWTWIDRFDYTNSTINNHPIAAKWNNWRTIMPVDNDELAKIYYKGLHSEFRDKLTTLMSIKLIIDTLKQKNISFLMTYQDDLMFDNRWNFTPAVIELQNYIKPHMTLFNGCSFLEWSRQNKFAISTSLHPKEEAHKVAGDYMINLFNTIK
jgi:hypothetical protein